MRVCYCGGTYAGGRCQRQGCPREHLGEGDWHSALPKLQELASRGMLRKRYPDLNIQDLVNHVDFHARRRAEEDARRHAHRRAGRVEAESRQHDEHQREPKRTGTWRRPRQQEHPPPGGASASSGGNPVKLEHSTDEVTDVVAGQSNAESVDRFTILDSDESDASIFGLRSALHDIDDCEELSESSSR